MVKVPGKLLADARISNKDFATRVAELTDSLRLSIEAGVSEFPTGQQDQTERRDRVQQDFGYFCRTYFPHYFTFEPSASQHDLISEAEEISDLKQGAASANAMPRGEGKSTIISMAWIIWLDVTGRKHYGLLVMDTYDQAALQLTAAKVEYESNPRLRMDYPEHAGQGRVWRENTIITTSGHKVDALGAGQKVRGRRHGPYRPDYVILDDLENDENVAKPEQRDKLERWIDRAVMKCGGPDGRLVVLYLGTVLHYDSVLKRKLDNPLWRGIRRQSIILWPHDMALWDDWEELLLNNGPAAADLFYRANEKQMLKGSRVSWPAARPLLQLMTIRARDGHAAFDSEHQNDPVSREGATFPELVFWIHELSNWIYVGACDPSLGKKGQGRDPSAILVGGWDRLNGILDLVEADIAKRVPSKIIADIIKYQQIYGCVRWGFETVQFQEYLRQQLIERSVLAGCPVPAAPISQSTDKTLRIESIEPYVSNGNIRLHPRHKTMLSQMRHHPKADHDDGPDCLEMLWRVATSMASLGGGIALGRRRTPLHQPGQMPY